MAFPLRVTLVLIVLVGAALYFVHHQGDSTEAIDVIHAETAVAQPDVEPLYLWRVYKKENDTEEKVKWQKRIIDLIGRRTHLDASVESILLLLLGPEKAFSLRKSNLPVDNLNCLYSMVELFEKYCGSLICYGVKHGRSLSHICRAGVSQAEMEEVCKAVCGGQQLALF